MTPSIVPLEQVRIEGFRGLRDVTLTLDREVTVLFGGNAAGKTSVLEAVAIALGALVARAPKAKGRDFARDGDLRRPWTNRGAERAGVEASYARVTARTAAGLTWDVTRWRSPQDRASHPAPHGSRALHETLDPIVRASLDASPGALVPPLPLVALYGNGRALVDIPLRERAFQRDFQRFGALDNALAANTRFKTVFEWFRVMEDEERREQGRRKDFAFRLPALEWVRKAVSSAGLRCMNPRVETRPIRMVVDFLHEDGSIEPLDITRLSDGFRTHFSLVVDVARRMVQLNPSDSLSDPKRGTNGPAIVLIDEIDLHLDPPWQSRVVAGLRAAFPNAQWLLTTHSEQVLGSVAARCVRRLRWVDGEIRVDPVPFAQGATSERILVELMNAPERVPGPVTTKLREYQALVSDGKGEDPAAAALRGELQQELGDDGALRTAELELQRRRLLAQLGGSSS